MTRVFSRIGIVALVSLWTTATLGQAPPASQPVPPTQPAAPSDVAVTVNGYPILEKTVTEQLRTYLPRETPEDIPQSAMTATLRAQVVDKLIDQRLLDEEVKRAGIKMTEEEIAEKALEEFRAYLAVNGLTREEFADQLRAEKGKTVEEFLADRKADPERRKTLLCNKMLAQKFPDDVRVTDGEIKEHYQAKLERKYMKPARVRASHILIGTEGMTDEQKAEAKKKAETVLVEARKPGVDFAALAGQYSTDVTRSRGGDVGFFPRTGALLEPFAAAAFALKVGEISDVVETKLGYHIIKVTGRADPEPIPLERAESGIRVLLEDQKIQMVRFRYAAELRKAAQIVYPEGKEPKRAVLPAGPVTTMPAAKPK